MNHIIRYKTKRHKNKQRQYCSLLNLIRHGIAQKFRKDLRYQMPTKLIHTCKLMTARNEQKKTITT